MKLLIADSRPFSSGGSPEDRHREELIAALRQAQPEWELVLYTPISQLQEIGQGPMSTAPWHLDGRTALAFLQRQLPQAAHDARASIILSLFGRAPLRAPVPTFSYLPDLQAKPAMSFMERIAAAAGRAGTDGAAGWVGYADEPDLDSSSLDRITLDPWVDPCFHPDPTPEDSRYLEALNLTPGYALGFGFSMDELPLLMAAWSWVVGSTGDSIPLVLLGMAGEAQAAIKDRVYPLNFDNTIQVRSTPPLEQLATLYRRADLFVSGGKRANAPVLRWALASGTPLAAIEAAHTESILGEAAYLTPAGDARRLGAAMLSILVEPALAAQLRERADARAGSYHRARPLQALEKVLLEFAA
ncbi:MAG: hypothetical protein E4G99_11590 [Anaerolineales bacterium]|nr:MAG: hypothetical protein E4G99_11590 [Anaerolineales bacterium]